VCGSELSSKIAATKNIKNKKRARGILKHTMSSLKKVARLLEKDRQQVLKVLEKCSEV